MEQLPEIIIIDGVLHTLYTTPLLPWLRKQPTPPEFDIRAPNCERGYVGRWMLREGVLWLTGLYAWRNGESTGVRDLFDDRREVEADWFSGPLIVEPASSEVSAGARIGITTILVEAGRVVETFDDGSGGAGEKQV